MASQSLPYIGNNKNIAIQIVSRLSFFFITPSVELGKLNYAFNNCVEYDIFLA
jgi:hypothetical protein